MKKEWKVYIKGVPNRGNEVVKALTDLGGKEPFYTGSYTNENFIFFINHKGEIDYEYLDTERGQIIMDNYREIKLPRWKPEYNGCFYLINSTGEVIERIWVNSQFDKLSLEFGNCFRTKEEAEAARDKIKELLNNKA